MKKKKVIVGIVLTLLLCVSILSCWKLCAEYKKQKAEAFEAKVKEMYGERNYLGPMTEGIEPLTEEELKELNPEEEPYIECGEYVPYIVECYGRFNRKKIRDIYDARKVICDMLGYLGISYDTYSFLYGEKSERINIKGKPYMVYQFQQYYKGIRVEGQYAEVVVDDTGDTYIFWNCCAPTEEIALDSVEPVYQGDKLQMALEEKYGECIIKAKELSICQYEGEYGLKWYLQIDASASPIHFLYMNANTGEILGEHTGEVY